MSGDEPTGTRMTLELRVEVELGPAVGAYADAASPLRAELSDRLAGHLRELLDGLGIPATPALEVRGSASEDAAPEGCRIRIGGRSCPLVQPVAIDGDTAPDRLAELVASAVVANRELLLTPAIVERVLEDWTARFAAVDHQISRAEFGRVLGELVRRGFTVAPVAIDTALGDGVGALPEQVFETIVAARGDVSVGVSVDPWLLAPAEPDADDADLSVMSSTLSSVLVDELGLVLPTVVFEEDPGLAGGRFRIRINDLRLPPAQGLLPDEVLVAASAEHLAEMRFTGRSVAHPANGSQAAILQADGAALAALAAGGYTVLGPRWFVAHAVRRELARHAGALLLPDLVSFQLSRVREEDAAVVDEAMRRFDRYLLTSILRRLLDEAVSIRDLPGILEGLLAVRTSVDVDQSRYDVLAPDPASFWVVPDGSEDATPGSDQYADCIRRHLRGPVTRTYANDASQLKVFDVDRRLEARIRQVPRPLDESELERLRGSVWSVYERLVADGTPVVVLTNSEVRRELRRLLEPEFPFLSILSRHEVAPGTDVQVLNRIAWA